MFQSTHLREVRRPVILANLPHTGFNPRTYERCDLDMAFCISTDRFQSTHLREVRRKVRGPMG